MSRTFKSKRLVFQGLVDDGDRDAGMSVWECCCGLQILSDRRPGPIMLRNGHVHTFKRTQDIT